MNSPKGYALIANVLVLSIVLVIVASAASLRVQNYLREDTGVERWDAAKRLSEGCMETALMRVREDAAYVGNETVVTANGSCTIRPLISSTSTTIQTEATVSGHPYRLQVVLDDVSTVHIASWEHVTSF